MKDERREPAPDMDGRSDNPGEQPGREINGRDVEAQKVRRGPISSAAGWFGNAFSRTSIGKQEAEERRRRNM